jgi:hypothetical protein
MTSQAVISSRKTGACLDLADISLSPLISTFPHLEAEYTPVYLLVNNKFMDLDDRKREQKIARIFRGEGRFGGKPSRDGIPASSIGSRQVSHSRPLIREISRWTSFGDPISVAWHDHAIAQGLNFQ